MSYAGDLNTPTPAEVLRAGTYCASGCRAWKPSRARFKAMREFILARDPYRCVTCGAEDLALDLDHIKPYKHGGYFIASNLQLMCWSCNGRKGAKEEAA